jgi:ATP-dependent Zn protease
MNRNAFEFREFDDDPNSATMRLPRNGEDSTVPEVSAYHEAGHAFMAYFVGARVKHVTIDPDRDDGPKRHADIQVEWPIDRLTKTQFHTFLAQVALAGPVAEMIYSGEPYHPGFVAEWSADWDLAWASAEQLVAGQRQQLAYLERMTAELYSLIERDDHWAAVAAVADNLLAHEHLDGEEVDEILKQWLV